MRIWVLATAIAATAGMAHAGSREVHYGPPPPWIAAPPAPSLAPSPQNAAVRFSYSDVQIRLAPGGDEIYVANRVKILQPQALALGNLTNTWNPSTDDLTINGLEIIRDGQAIDVLAGTKFKVIERENELEYSKLDGDLTANLQIPDLRVGDEIQFAATIKRRVQAFGGRSFNLTQLPLVGLPGTYRVRLIWSDPKPLRWRLSPDLGQPTLTRHGAEHELTYELQDPGSVIVADDAPTRYNVRRLIEYSDFSSWAEVSSFLWPLFDKASTLAPGSPLRAEAAKIAASTKDPAARAQAALALVQDRIRYVYVGLNGGNYQPASADETWSRRFGDCKGKTVVLLALLRELGVPAEAVLVNSKGGDGTDQRLPTPSMFDHVLVRARVGTHTYWLDGTRLGDRRLDALPPPIFRWALPIRPAQAQLEAVPALPPALPLVESVIDLDARAGFDVPAKVRAEDVLRGDDARQALIQLSSMAAEDARRAVEGIWRQAESWIEPEKVGWSYDEVGDSLILTLSGHAKLDWDGDASSGRSLQIPHAGITPPAEMHRPKEQDQTAPWLIEFPSFKRWTTIVRLPQAPPRWSWSYSAAPVYEQLGGVTFWRDASLKDGVMFTTMGRRADQPEITAAQAREANDRLPSFDNKISEVFQVRAGSAQSPDAATAAPTAAPGVKAALATRDKAHSAELRAQAEAKAGRLEQALADDSEALTIEPDSAALFRERASILDSLGRQREALSDLDEAWRINPLDPNTNAARARELKLASAQKASGLPYDPWEDPDTVAVVAAPKDQPESADDFVGDGAALAQKGQLDQALAAYEKAIALEPDDAEAYGQRGSVYGSKGELDRAISDFNRAIALKPTLVQPVLSRAIAYAQKRLYSKAIEDFDRAVRLNPTFALAYYARGGCYARMGNSAMAQKDFDMAISLKLQNPNYYRGIGVYYASHANYEKAADALAEAVAMNPKDVSALKVLADVEEQLGHRDEAIADYRAALKLSPELADAKDGLRRLHASP